MDYTAFATENARAEFSLPSRDSRDLAEAHRALRQIIEFLDGIKGGADRIGYVLCHRAGDRRGALRPRGVRWTEDRMKRTVYALEITLTRIDCHTDKYGARLPNTPEQQTSLRSHYDGSHSKPKARAIYDRLDAVLNEMQLGDR